MFTLPVASQLIPDEEEDVPIPGIPVDKVDGPLKLPALLVGAGTFSNQYNTDDHLGSHTPVRLVRLALRYGIRAFDTSIYYGPSELVLGNALQLVKDEFPRSHYQIMTKCGRFGPNNFDYTPFAIRDSVKRSLDRLQTSYLDTVYLHDVEFVCTPFLAKTTGDHSSALAEEKAKYGLAEGEEAMVRGDGDQKILDAFAELRKMKDEGLINHIGITGYPVPTLLRLALLILHTPPYKPVDVVLSYSHLSLQNDTFIKFIPHFRERAQVTQLVAASPFSMGLLTPTGPPAWHPAPDTLRQATARVRAEYPGLPALALGYSIQKCMEADLPLVAGFSGTREVHECVKIWRDVKAGIDAEKRNKDTMRARELFDQHGYLAWSWSSP